VIKHLADDSLRAMLAEVKRVLRPGGRFVVWEGAPARSKAMQWWNLRMLRLVASVAYLRGPDELRRFLDEAGFVEARPFGVGPYLYYPPLPRAGFIVTRP
jgi:ubiquinone/menaquinone biosynthesis C-methylase UbiE